MSASVVDLAAWRAERRTYIGASDAPVLTGDDPWRSEFDLWLEKTGRSDGFEGNAVTRWGQRVEQVAADIYEEETGRRLHRFGREENGVFVPRVVRHKRWPFIACNPDREVIGGAKRGDRRLVQIKSAWRMWPRDPDTGKVIVPDRVMVQEQQEMGVVGADVADVALLVGFGEFEIVEIPRNELMIERIFRIDRGWWQRHIVDGIEPERTGRHLRDLRGEAVMNAASELQLEAARAYTDLGGEIKALEAKRRNAQEWLKRSLAGAKKLVDVPAGLSITWTPWEKTVDETDWKLIADAYAHLIDDAHGNSPRSEADALMDLGLPFDMDLVEALGAIRSLYTRPVVKSGEAWQVRWKDADAASEEEAA
jgi:putative phage-type endonuclease